MITVGGQVDPTLPDGTMLTNEVMVGAAEFSPITVTEDTLVGSSPGKRGRNYSR
jgi:hypothetical protein